MLDSSSSAMMPFPVILHRLARLRRATLINNKHKTNNNKKITIENNVIKNSFKWHFDKIGVLKFCAFVPDDDYVLLL